MLQQHTSQWLHHTLAKVVEFRSTFIYLSTRVFNFLEAQLSCLARRRAIWQQTTSQAPRVDSSFNPLCKKKWSVYIRKRKCGPTKSRTIEMEMRFSENQIFLGSSLRHIVCDSRRVGERNDVKSLTSFRARAARVCNQLNNCADKSWNLTINDCETIDFPRQTDAFKCLRNFTHSIPILKLVTNREHS